MSHSCPDLAASTADNLSAASIANDRLAPRSLVIDATGFLLIMMAVILASILLDLHHAWVMLHSFILLMVWLLSQSTVTRQRKVVG